MSKNTRLNYRIITLLLVLAAVVLGVWAYAVLPETVATHWNWRGEADGYSGKFWGSFLMPLVVVGIYLLYLLVPKIVIHKKNFESFRSSYDRFFSSFMLFMLLISASTFWWNTVGEFSFNRVLAAGFALLFWESAELIKNARKNWFVGIRTPWTLSSDRVWKETHELGHQLFRASAGLSLIGFFLPGLTIILLVLPILSTSIYLVIYSYFRYKSL